MFRPVQKLLICWLQTANLYSFLSPSKLFGFVYSVYKPMVLPKVYTQNAHGYPRNWRYSTKHMEPQLIHISTTLITTTTNI